MCVVSFNIIIQRKLNLDSEQAVHEEISVNQGDKLLSYRTDPTGNLTFSLQHGQQVLQPESKHTMCVPIILINAGMERFSLQHFTFNPDQFLQHKNQLKSLQNWQGHDLLYMGRLIDSWEKQSGQGIRYVYFYMIVATGTVYKKYI